MNLVRKVKLFVGETAGELKKTQWPTGREFIHGTWVVFAGALFIGCFVAVVDFSLFQVINLMTDSLR
jgi:preprotein translocase SecE subunit